MNEAEVLASVIAINASLNTLSRLLGYIKGKTATKADDRLAVIVSRLAGYSQAVIEFIGFAKSRRPQVSETPAEKK